MPEREPELGAGRSPIFEREAELAALEGLLSAVCGGEGGLVVVEGSAGIGKTRLLGAARELALASGVEVLSARGGELEQEFAFGVVRQLFELPLAAATSDARAELLSGAAGLSSSLFVSAPVDVLRGGRESSFAMLHGLYWLAANFALRKPTLLAVDDLHWADEPSLRWLIYLARRLEGLPLLLLLGTRALGQAGASALAGELLADPTGLVMHPGSLGRESAAALARERLGAEPDPVFSAALEKSSGGNPLYLVALLDAARRQGLAPTAKHAPRVLALGPGAVLHGVSRQLRRLPAGASDLLRAAAILGDRTELPLAAALAGLDMSTAVGAFSALVRSGLLRRDGRIEFVHPVVRTTVVQDMGGAELARVHRRAAEVLIRAGAPAEQAAAHLAQTLPGDDRFVVATLRRAAERSMAHGAPGAAVAYLRRALDEPPEQAERVDVLFELGLAELTSDAGDASAHLSRAMALLGDVAERPDIVLAYAHALFLDDRGDDAMNLLQRASDRIHDVDRALHFRLEARLIFGTQYEPGLQELRRQRLAALQLDKLGEGIGAAMLLAEMAFEEARRGVSRTQAVDCAIRAVGSGAFIESEELLFVLSALYTLMLAGEVAEAGHRFRDAIAAAQRRGDLLNMAVASLVRAMMRHEQGELLGAEEDVRTAELAEWPNGQAERVACLAEILLEEGQIEAAREAVAHPVACAPGYKIHFLQARGRVRLATGHPELALPDFLAAGNIAESLAIENPALSPWRAYTALTLRRLGRQGEARDLAAAELNLSRRWGALRCVGISLRALGLVENGPAGEELLREAVAVLAESPARLEHARAVIDLGANLRRGNSRTEARRLLRDGIERAHHCGASALVKRGNDELAAAGGHPLSILLSGAGVLTPSERRVAQIAAEGSTNKEIAQALFVTVKTVEMHLGRVYRKLDIDSRRELSAALASRAASPEPR